MRISNSRWDNNVNVIYNLELYELGYFIINIILYILLKLYSTRYNAHCTMFMYVNIGTSISGILQYAIFWNETL